MEFLSHHEKVKDSYGIRKEKYHNGIFRELCLT
jgi:hypothetical protein